MTDQFPHIKIKLKTTGIKPFREAMLLKQNHLCALCNQFIDITSTNGPVLDHRHSDGAIRSVLHRHCNSYLGRLENSITRYKIQDDQLKTILENAYDYMKITSNYLHPTYKSPIDKLIARQKKKKKR
jgi:hypothetical protein